jgi:DNA repair exonuclease SbcCD ATPase subunit
VFIPGNHDQVTHNGRVHGVRIFQGYPNITVATEPIHWPERQLAFLPWREDPAEQAAVFVAVPAGWTIFAHAEAPGALANSGKAMPGRFNYRLNGHRAIYLGHFHKRQQIGPVCWYIGSPFEMDMGERGDPHGVAIISQNQVEPEPMWVDWTDFPKHHRLTFGEAWDPKYIGEHDIVEVHAAPAEIGTPDFAEALTLIPAKDIRPLPLKNGQGDEAPQFALTLDQAIDTWVDNAELEVERAVQIKLLGRELLKQAEGARAIVPCSPYVSIDEVTATNFCAIRGELSFTMPKGESLIRGPMGVGKTSIMDAMTWCLFGVTSPRKAGSHGASLRADEVVHDDAFQCQVSVYLTHQDGGKVTVTRTKERGKGSRIEITGVEAGISDQQEQIHHALGIDYDLWRTCVYLGQGAVGTFVTDADKRRKGLFDTAFGLNACPGGQRAARDRWKQLGVQVEKLRIDIVGDHKVLEVLRETDYSVQIEQWLKERTDRLSAIRASGEQAAVVVKQCEEHLQQEDHWLQSKEQHEQHIDTLTKSLAKAAPAAQVANLQRDYGAIQAERALVDRDLGAARAELQKHVEARQAGQEAACPTCGRPFEQATAEQHIQELEAKVQSKAQEAKTFDVKLSNVAAKLDTANSQGSAQREGIQVQIGESREALQKCADALNAFVRIKTNRADAERRLHEARAEYAQAEQAPNPYLAKQAEQAERIKTVEAKLLADEAELKGFTSRQQDFAFWDQGFGPKGIPVLVLRAALHELEMYANRFMALLLAGRIYCRLSMEGDDLKILFYEYDEVTGTARERRYEQLSGGQRRCVELAFNPFALSEMIFNRCGVRVSLLVVDELTTHLGQAEKPIICEILRKLDRDSIIVIDHDAAVQGEFDQVFDLSRAEGALQLQRAV